MKNVLTDQIEELLLSIQSSWKCYFNQLFHPSGITKGKGNNPTLIKCYSIRRYLFNRDVFLNILQEEGETMT